MEFVLFAGGARSHSNSRGEFWGKTLCRPQLAQPLASSSAVQVQCQTSPAVSNPVAFPSFSVSDRSSYQNSLKFQQKVVTSLVEGILGLPIVGPKLRLAARDAFKGAIRAAGRRDGSEQQVKEMLFESVDVQNLQSFKEQIEDRNVRYPEYFSADFHWTGNLSYEATMEALVFWEIIEKIRYPDKSFLEVRKILGDLYRQELGRIISSPVKDAIDLGCGQGLSTFFLREIFPEAEVTAVDLSPFFLSVAQCLFAEYEIRNVKLVHANAEATGLPSSSYDFISMLEVLHEVPAEGTMKILKECHRLLRPGGYLWIADIDPEHVPEMKPMDVALFLNTEAFAHEYFTLDFSSALKAMGFHPPEVLRVVPRQRIIVARKM